MIAHAQPVNRIDVNHRPKCPDFLVFVDDFQCFFQDFIFQNGYTDLSRLGSLGDVGEGSIFGLFFPWIKGGRLFIGAFLLFNSLMYTTSYNHTRLFGSMADFPSP